MVKPDYSKIYVTLYSDPVFLSLPMRLRWLYVVILTGSQKNRIGCYVCRLSVLGEDMGDTVTQSDIDTLSKVMGIGYNIPYRIVYIPNWMKWNAPDSSKVLISYVKAAANLPKCELTNTLYDNLSNTLSQIESMHGCGRGFTDLWAELYKPSGYPIGYPIAYHEHEHKHEHEQKHEQLQNQDHKQNIHAPRSTERNAVPDDLFLTYPCNGSPNVYHLTMAQVNEWSMLYQGLDVASECKKALAWIQANNKKTAKGMPKFLVGWLSRSNDRSPKRQGKANMSLKDELQIHKDFAADVMAGFNKKQEKVVNG